MYTRKGRFASAQDLCKIIPPRKGKASFKCYLLPSFKGVQIHSLFTFTILGAKCKPKTNFLIMSMEVTLFQQITLLEMSMDLKPTG